MCKIWPAATLILAMGLAWPNAARSDDGPSPSALLKLHTDEAGSYQIFRDEQHKQRLDFNEKPVFSWTNVSGNTLPQNGHLFVWTNAGRPEVIGTVFSLHNSENGKRAIIDEFHTLSSSRLFPVTPDSSRYKWEPESGIELVELKKAPAVADSPTKRLLQLKEVAKTFTAQTSNRDGKWELRLLTTPLFRYQSTSGDVLDGALFAMVGSEGTDPEAILLIEARHPEGDLKNWSWFAAAVRFSDRDVLARAGEQTLLSSVDDPAKAAAIKDNYRLIETPDQTYKCFRAREIPELPSEP
jgi:hypothetical protein